MAFADYFEKNFQSAALLLQGIDAQVFQKTLEREIVGIAVGEEALRSKEGQAIVDLSTRLLARLYPTLAFVPVGGLAPKRLSAFEALARAINSKLDIEKDHKRVTQCIVVGDERPRTSKSQGAFFVYVGSDNWIARISTKQAMSCGNSGNPFGPGAAACLGVANIFRRSFREELPQAKLDEQLAFSTLELAPVASSKVRNPPLKPFTLGAVHLAGVGAIGNGFLWALARLDATGSVHAVDEEPLARSNLQRYVLTSQDDVDEPKVELAKRWFAKSSLELKPHRHRWETFVGQAAGSKIDQVAVAVDTARTRINVQASLPRTIFNSWTQAGEVGLSRHTFDASGACLACLYMPDRPAPNYDQLIIRALHLQETREQLLDVRKRLRLSVPTDEDFLKQVSAAAGVPLEELLPFKGKSLQSLYSDGICGGAVLTLAKGGRPVVHNEVPMAFQSALAGILMAADLICESLALRQRLPTKTQINLLTAVAPFPSNGQAKSPRCFCRDPDFIEAFAKKYPDQGTSKSRLAAKKGGSRAVVA